MKTDLEKKIEEFAKMLGVSVEYAKKKHKNFIEEILTKIIEKGKK